MPSTRVPRVIFDASSLRYLHTGLGQVSYHFLQEWSLLNPHDMQLYALVHPRLRNLVPPNINIEPANYLRRHAPPGLQRFLYFGRNLWHMSTENTRLTGIPPGVPLIITIQGLHFLDEIEGEKAQKELMKVQQLVNRSVVITTGSQFTADLVRSKLDIGRKSIQVIPYGVKIGAPSEKPPSWAPTTPFLFSVATFFERKNLHVLIPMMKYLPEYKLILAGDSNRSYGKRIIDLIRSQELENQILLPGEITEQEKFWLYTNGEALLFPSISEGFGIPTIESFNFGKPVCSSRYGSLPEVGGEFATYWDNFEPEYMANTVRSALSQDARLSEKRKEYAAQFTWSKMVERYHELYRRILAGELQVPSV